jgi:hypothetical protein
MGEKAFRLNTDLIRDYKIKWCASGFEIASPPGRRLNSSEICSVYWRKPFTSLEYSDSSHPDRFFYSEARYLVREMYNFLRRSGIHSLVEEGAERRLGKLGQLQIAEKYFDVPDWRILLGQDYLAPEYTVVKSLSGDEVDDDNVLYTTRADYQTLDPSYIWFLQSAIEKASDLTVCFVNGKVFAYELVATPGVTDWRAQLDKPETREWKQVGLRPETIERIRNFMEDCRLQFGRLDFVQTRNGQLFFLEVNPNGQWAWLDLQDSTGLITAMISAIEGQDVEQQAAMQSLIG